MRFKRMTVCLDMRGCPERCRHCWLGGRPNGRMEREELVWAAEDFRPFTESLEVFDWYREPDFADDYRELWDLRCALSGHVTPHFNLASVWRLARDGSYAPWLRELGVETVQLTVFGGKAMTDRWTGRRGAYRDILRSIDVLLENGIAPRIQTFLNRETAEGLPQVEALVRELESRTGGRPVCFVHQGSCDGENEKNYPIWPTPEELEKIPPLLVEGTLRRFGAERLEDVFGQTEAALYEALADSGETASYVESEPVFYVDGSFDVYPNVTAPSPWWRLGNWKRDGAEAVLENYRESRSFAQRARLTVPVGELVRAYGDPESRRLFGRDDYIELMLARYCREHWEGGAS